MLAVSNCKCQDSLAQYNEQTSLCCTEQSVKFLRDLHYPGSNHQVCPNLTLLLHSIHENCGVATVRQSSGQNWPGWLQYLLSRFLGGGRCGRGAPSDWWGFLLGEIMNWHKMRANPANANNLLILLAFKVNDSTSIHWQQAIQNSIQGTFLSEVNAWETSVVTDPSNGF